MDWLQLILLALIQGVTEFLPISSSAHLVLPALLTDWPDQGLEFDIAVHLGTLTAVVIYFRSDLQQFAVGGVRRLAGTPNEPATLMMKLAVATLPIAVAGFALQGWVETQARSVLVIALATIGFGLALWWADRRHGEALELSWAHAWIIGGAQVLALIPGTSRSGITITAALLLGLSRTSAARFSFLLSIPTIFGAALLAVSGLLSAGDDTRWLDMLVGGSVAAVSAFFCISAFVALLERTGMLPYVIYRLVLGSILLGLLAAGIGQIG
ncbi:MAG: undecaprenyl-diphosphate phosphatase [Gammaproteobacteria bacterium]|nr:undecaprenyl-diphosphate phosphatase [Gammaproteobacteria bacterium]